MTVYGLQADIDKNPGRNVQLYVPGKTKLVPGDTFLGGPGTGVADEMLGAGITRIYGNTADDTAKAFDEYNSGPSSQIKAAQAQNAAPRADAAMGMPTLARQQFEQDQAQSAVSNNLANKTFIENLRQAALDNEWKQKAFDYGVAKDTKAFDYAANQDSINNEYKNAALAASMARASSGGSGGGFSPKLTVGQQADYATADAIEAIQRDAPNMTREEFNTAMITIKPQFIRDGVDMKVIQDAIDSVQTKDEIEAANNKTYEEENTKAWNDLSLWERLKRGTMFN